MKKACKPWKGNKKLIQCIREEGSGIELERCAFCGKSIGEVDKLIKAPDSDIYICETCSQVVFRLSGDSNKQKNAKKRRDELKKAIAATGTVKRGLPQHRQRSEGVGSLCYRAGEGKENDFCRSIQPW